MTDDRLIERECSVFCRYLCDHEPSDYLRAKYRAAHLLGVVESPNGASRFDRTLVAFARLGPWATRALDSYSRVFANGGLLRRKLVLVLALLETKSPTDQDVDSPSVGSNAAFVVGCAWLSLVFACTVILTAIVLLPLRVFYALNSNRNG